MIKLTTLPKPSYLANICDGNTHGEDGAPTPGALYRKPQVDSAQSI